MGRLFGAALTVSMLCLVTGAQAQGNNDRWSCEALLRALVDLPKIPLDAANAGQPLGLIEFNGSRIQDDDDAVSISEFPATNSRELVAISAFGLEENISSDAQDTPDLVQCAKFDAQFQNPSATSILSLGEISGQRNGDSDGVRIIVVDTASAEQVPDLRGRWAVWRNQRYNVPVLVDSAKRLGNWIPFDASNIQPLGLWGAQRLRPEHVVFVPAASQNEPLFKALGVRPVEGLVQRKPLLVLCQPVSCDEIVTAVARGPAMSPRDGTPTTPKVTTPALPDTDIEQEKPVVVTRDPESQTCVPAQTQTCAQPDPATLLPTLFGRNPNGRVPLDYAQFGGLECLITLVAPDFFRTQPRCDAPQFRALEGKRLVVEQLGVGTWVVGAAPPIQLEKITVKLPEGQDGISCLMVVRYTNRNGVLTAANLRPTDNTSSTYAATLDIPPQLNGEGQVIFDIDVSDAAACGAQGRRVTEEVTDVNLSVTLAQEARTNRKLVYVSLANDPNLDLFGISGTGREDLNLSIHAAILSAHQRASHLFGAKSWSLSEVSMIALDPTSTARVLARVAGNPLRTEPTERLRVDTYELKNAATGALFSISATSLTEALTNVALQHTDADELTLALIAPFSDMSPVAGINVCEGEVYRNVAQTVRLAMGGSQIKLVVFPIAGLPDGMTPDLNDIELQGFQRSKPELSSDLVLCKDQSQDVSMQPFFAETWRSPSDLTARYEVALGDALGTLLKDLIDD